MLYEVRALEANNAVTLVIDALNEGDVCRQVEARMLTPLSIKPAAGFGLKHRKRTVAFSLVLFTQELLALLEAGLTVVEALDTLLEKERRPQARNVLQQLVLSLKEGKSFSGAQEALPEIFPSLYVSIVRAAERTSNLPEALGRYIDYQTRLDAIKSKIVSASIYPLILLVVGGTVALFLLGYVVPRFATVYQGTGRQLPWLSSLLMQWGSFVGAHRSAILVGAVAGTVGLVAVVRRLAGKGGIVSAMIRVPILREKVRIFELARFYLTLGMLLDGGLPIVQGLALVGELLSPDLRGRVENATRSLQCGEPISHAFEDCGLTTPVGLRMLRVGEQSGRMGEMMGRTAKFYDGEIGRAIEWFSKVFEPVLMTAVGIVVGLIVVLLYMPIFDLAGSLS